MGISWVGIDGNGCSGLWSAAAILCMDDEDVEGLDREGRDGFLIGGCIYTFFTLILIFLLYP